MAEVFGIITGGVGVVSLAIQLADSIKKLRDFCDLVKEAPGEVRLALDEVELLSYVLQDIEQGLQGNGACSSSVDVAVTRSIRFCQTANGALKLLAEELHNEMASKKRWASLKAASKSDRLVKLRCQLERAKTTLMLANQCYYNTIQREGWERHRRDMNELNLIISSLARTTESMVATESLPHIDNFRADHDLEQPSNKSDRLEDLENKPGEMALGFPLWQSQQVGWSSTLFGAFNFKKTRRWRDREQIIAKSVQNVDTFDQICVSVQLPLWLNGTRYQLRSRRAYTGWDHSFRTYNIVPYSASVIELCRRGHLEGLISLFNGGLASPFDMDIGGGTLLHHAVLMGRLEVAKFLVGCGVDATSRTSTMVGESAVEYQREFKVPIIARDSTALDILGLEGGILTRPEINVEDNRQHLDERQYQDLLRLLLEKGGGDPTDTDRDGENLLGKYQGPTASFHWLLEQCPPLNLCWPQTNAPLWKIRFYSYWNNSLDLIRDVLPNGRVDTATAEQRDEMGASILHHTISRWSDCFTNLAFYLPQQAQGFEDLLKEIIRAGADIHAMTYLGDSPLTALLFDLTHGTLYPKHYFRQPYIVRRRRVAYVPDLKLGGHRIVHFPDLKSRRRIRKNIATWLTVLKSLNVDLDAYLEKEKSRLDRAYLKDDCGILDVELAQNCIKIKWVDSEDPRLVQVEMYGLLGFVQFWHSLGEWDHYVDHGEEINYGGECICFDIESNGTNSDSSDSDDDSVSNSYDDSDELPKIPGAWN